MRRQVLTCQDVNVWPERALDFAFGTSVGGELVALAALTGPHSTFDVGPFPTESSGVLAVADFFGPANVTEAASGFSASGRRDAFGDNQESPILASPAHYVRPQAPPILNRSRRQRHQGPRITGDRALHGPTESR